MATLLAAFIFMLVLVAAMAIGVILSNKPIKGTCGGINALGMGQDCDVCGGKPEDCTKDEIEQSGDASLAYDASKS